MLRKSVLKYSLVLGLATIVTATVILLGTRKLKLELSQQPVHNQVQEKITEECPLNGKLYPKNQKDFWQKRRPLGIMIDNSLEARPQSGLSGADIIYEAVIEAGATRLLAIYYCQNPEVVGPIRSARSYFLDWISEYGQFPLFAHVGGANTPGRANALGQINQYGWSLYNDINEHKIGFPTFWADYDRTGKNVATEHTMYTSPLKVWDFAAIEKKLTNQQTDKTTGKVGNWDENFTRWKFKESSSSTQIQGKPSAQILFSSSQSATATNYAVIWQYDPLSSKYLRFNGGEKFADFSNGAQIAVNNVIILFMKSFSAGDGYIEENLGYHILYETIGQGIAKFLINGQIIEGTWTKKSRTTRTIFLDQQNKEIFLNRGQTWIELLPSGGKVTFDNNLTK